MRSSTTLASLALLLLGATGAQAARCEVTGPPLLEGRVSGGTVSGRTVDARRGEEIEVALVVPGRLAGKAVVFGEDAGRGQVSWERAGCGPRRISWRRVEPRMEHVLTKAPNRDISVYANAVVFGPSHGKWIGFDRIEYVETPLSGEGPVLRLRDARPSAAAGVAERDAALSGLGTLHLAATMEAGAGATFSTPDARDAPSGLLSDRVFRYTFRSGDDFLGWLTSFFNVPYLFGSAGKGAGSQAERYLGADCADVLVAALRRAGFRGQDYSSVAGLVESLQKVAGPVVVRPCEGACPPAQEEAARLQIGRDVRPGDLLALDYIGADSLPRAWDHIGVLVEDRGPGGRPDGVLGPEDLFADSGSAAGLKFAPLGEQGAVRVIALRPRPPGRQGR